MDVAIPIKDIKFSEISRQSALKSLNRISLDLTIKGK